jgi:hypothetical protein
MMETVSLDVINKNLKIIIKELEEIKEYMADVDSLLSEDDISALREARKELKTGKIVTLEEFERQLGL